ncbi:MAG: hypothetical protein PF489_11815 [Salinivirgaceae bacterium]|jgi:hypothetical protein|nr:hypothetical protein [Salinivirgaceae bacterium]
MAKNSYDYTAFAFQQLKDLIATKVGFEIKTIRDCKEVSNVLETKGLHVSPHTIGRFYQVIKNNNMPSQFTLDQLSDFAGYDLWDTFFKSTSDGFKQALDQNTTTQSENYDSELSLIRFCLQDQAYQPLINYLKANRSITAGGNDKKLFAIFNIIAEVIDKQTHSRHELYDFLVTDTMWALAYFKHMIPADAIHSHYGEAVKKHFLKIIHPSEKEYSSKLIWGYTIMAMQAFYSHRKKKFLEYSYELFKLSPPEQNTLNYHTYGIDVQVWVFARYHFVRLLYMFYSDQITNKEIDKEIYFLYIEMENASNYARIIILSFINEVLWIINQEEQILQFTDYYIEALNDCDVILNEGGEALKALAAMILFYNMAVAKFNIPIDTPLVTQKINDLRISSENANKNPFAHTYEIYKNEILAMISNDKGQSLAFLNNARQHALKIKNKYFISQIDRFESRLS